MRACTDVKKMSKEKGHLIFCRNYQTIYFHEKVNISTGPFWGPVYNTSLKYREWADLGRRCSSGFCRISKRTRANIYFFTKILSLMVPLNDFSVHFFCSFIFLQYMFETLVGRSAGLVSYLRIHTQQKLWKESMMHESTFSWTVSNVLKNFMQHHLEHIDDTRCAYLVGSAVGKTFFLAITTFLRDMP